MSEHSFTIWSRIQQKEISHVHAWNVIFTSRENKRKTFPFRTFLHSSIHIKLKTRLKEIEHTWVFYVYIDFFFLCCYSHWYSKLLLFFLRNYIKRKEFFEHLMQCLWIIKFVFIMKFLRACFLFEKVLSFAANNFVSVNF